MNKKVILIISIILIILVSIIIIKKDKTDKSTTNFENDTTISEVVVEEITFSNIRKTYNEGITTINADVVNNTEKTKDANVKITVTDKDGKEVTTMIQILESLKPNKKQVLSTGIVGNYTDKMYEINIELISDKEIENLNK